MKGMIFTEFLEMVEEKFSLTMVDHIISSADLPSGGVYTSVGTYAHEEIVQLVHHLSDATAIPIPNLLYIFGERLFEKFSLKYAHFLAGADSSLSFLEQLETYVHAEVRKLYPEAELPKFECCRTPDGRLTMLYRSNRSMADLARGLIHGCVRYFGEEIEVTQEDLSNGIGSVVKFVLIPSQQIAQG